MSIYHLSVKIIGRSGGRDSTAASAYRARDIIRDKKTEHIYDYSKKKVDLMFEQIFVPAGCTWNPSRSELWNDVEAKNIRKDSRTAREFEIALPFELTQGQRQELLVDFVREVVERQKCAADAVIHNEKDGNKNFHGHVMFTTNFVDGNGLGGKNRNADKKEELEFLRERWATMANEKLKKLGIEERIDHRSNYERGIKRIPTMHEGTSVVAMERAGTPTKKRAENVARTAINERVKFFELEKTKTAKSEYYRERREIFGEARQIAKTKKLDWKIIRDKLQKSNLDFRLKVAEELRQKLRSVIDEAEREREEAQKKQQKPEVLAKKEVVQQPKIEILETEPERPKFATWQDKIGWRKLHPLTEEECEKLFDIQREEKLLAQKISPKEAKRSIEEKYPEESQDLEIWNYNKRKKMEQEAANVKKDVAPILPTPETEPEEPEEAKIVEKTLDERMTMAKDSAASIVARQNVHEALDSKPYRGTFVKIIEGVILLQTRKDEIVLVPEDDLAKNPEVGDKINISPIRNVGDKREVSLIERGHGR